MTTDVQPGFAGDLIQRLRQSDTWVQTGSVTLTEASEAARQLHNATVGPLVQAIEMALRHLDPNEYRGESTPHARITLRGALDGLERGQRWVSEAYHRDLLRDRAGSSDRVYGENRKLRALLREAHVQLKAQDVPTAAVRDLLERIEEVGP